MEEINGELVLRDVLDKICHYLNIKDLSKVCLVCRSWREEALKEINKRYFQLQILYGTSNKNPSFQISHWLYNKPQVTLLFAGIGSASLELFNFNMRPYRFDPYNNDDDEKLELEYEIIKAYRKYFPNKLITVGFSEISVNEFITPTFPIIYYKDIADRKIPNRTVMLSLPQNKYLNIKESHIFESEFQSRAITKFDSMIKDLLPDSTATKSTLFLFISNPNGRNYDSNRSLITVLKTIKSTFAGKSYTLWGVVTSQKIFASDKFNKDASGKEEKEARAVGLNLFGPNLESWALPININISKDELDEKLNAFKKKINLKRCKLGFLTAPKRTRESDDVTCYKLHERLIIHIKSVFREVPFLGGFCEDLNSYFAINDTSEAISGLVSDKIISIMILSYE